MDGLVFFHYDDGSRSQETAWKLLQTFKGYLQSDGYAAYNIFEGKKEVCLVGCLAHIRRHYEVAKEENESLAGYVLAQIQQLYRIEQIADQEELTYEQRMLRRQEQALPILEQLEKWMETAYPKVLPKSRMGQAIAYAYQLWPRMRNYLKDGRLKIDNNLAENAIRPIALSRKNFLFCGNHEAAQNTAIICSLLASCKASNINPREWLTEGIALLPYYAANKEKDLKELLPHCWESGNSKEL
jgi:transposase